MQSSTAVYLPDSLESMSFPRLALAASCVLASGSLVAVAIADDAGQGQPGTGTASPGRTVTATPRPGAPTLGLPTVPASERTFPRALPRIGTRDAAFAIYFTLRSQPGHKGVVATDYRVQVDAPPHTRARCAAPQPDNVTTGQRGRVRRVALTAPSGTWCPGRYSVTIFLQRGPYCPKPADGQPPTPCPEFASQDLDSGRAHFRVRPAP